jgi:hypothetical protein
MILVTIGTEAEAEGHPPECGEVVTGEVQGNGVSSFTVSRAGESTAPVATVDTADIHFDPHNHEYNPPIAQVNERVPRQVRDHILQKQNVHSVGIGLEKKNGRYTGNVCVTAVVDQKIPLSELEPEHIVPFELSGVAVDVVEDDIPTPADESLANPGNNNELQTEVRNTIISPLAGGLAGSGGSAGTLPGSARLQDEDGDIVSITNRHIACEQDEDCTGEPVYQPRRFNPDGYRTVGQVKKLGPFDPNGPVEDNMDVATIKHDENQVELSNRYFGLRKQVDFAEPELGRRIVNAGARTGFTSGFVSAVDVSVQVTFSPDPISFTGVFRYESDGITAGGDSGSIVGYVTPDGDIQPVGNNFSGTATSGTAMPFGKIQSFFGTLTTPSGTYGTPISASRSISLLEVAVWRMQKDDQTGEAIVEYFVSNTGGQTTTDTVEVLDGSNTVASRTHSQIQPGTFEFDSFRISQQFFQQTLTIRTTDHIDSVFIDFSLLEDSENGGAGDDGCTSSFSHDIDPDDDILPEIRVNGSKVYTNDRNPVTTDPGSGGDINIIEQ